jgi:hypothetical protein
MPTKRTKRNPARVGLSEAAIAAWKIGDFHALARALELVPFQPHPWPLELTALGCHQGPPPADAGELWRQGWPRAQLLQRALLEVAGEPGMMGRHGEPGEPR